MKDKNRKIQKKQAKGRIKAIKNIFFWVIAAGIFFSLVGYTLLTNIKIGNVRTIYLDKVDALQKQIKEAEDKKALLEKGLSQVGKTEYLEEIARKQFGLKAPGEEVAVVVKNQQTQNNSNNANENTSPAKPNLWNPLTWWRWIVGK